MKTRNAGMLLAAAMIAGACGSSVTAPPSPPATAVQPTPEAALHIENRGGPEFALEISGKRVITVACGAVEQLYPGKPPAPDLPWDLTVRRSADGAVILRTQVTDVPRWLVQVGDTIAGELPSSPVEGIPGPTCPPG